jgi:hypothetical protein
LKGTRAIKEVTMDKNIIKETTLSLEGADFQSADALSAQVRPWWGRGR